MNSHIVSGWIEACKDHYYRYNFFKKCSLDDRVLGLLSVACCREVWNTFDERSKKAVEVVELYADGLTTKEELKKAYDDAWHAYYYVVSTGAAAAYATAAIYSVGAAAAAYVAHSAIHSASNIDQYTQQGLILASMCPITFSDNWITSTTNSLAQQIYDKKDFSLMPILADALQDVDCNEEILNHLRSPGPFYKGNYIIDKLIGKRS